MVRGSDAEDGDGEGGDYGVAVCFEVAAVGLEAGDEDIGLGLLGGKAEGFGNVATADKNFSVGAHFFLEGGHVFGSVADKFLFPDGIFVIAARAPGLDRSGDVREG